MAEETFLKIQTGILRTDAAAKFFAAKILKVNFKSIKQKSVETDMGIFNVCLKISFI